MSLNSCVLYPLLAVIISNVSAQDDFGGGDDAGADLDMESMLGGNDAGGKSTANPNGFNTFQSKTIFEESVSALQQLGFIIGVCFLVGSLFMAMVGLEILYEKVMEKYDSMRGKNEEPETHPADMVGKFSRYK